MDTDLIIFGVQGSGKGTQARILAERCNMKVFETGAELRKIKEEPTELGRLVRSIIEAGNLVPNEIVMRIVEQFLDGVKIEELVIFDGLPRSTVQKTSFDKLLEERGRRFRGLYLDLSREEAVRRMLSRGRSDDTEDAIQNRLKNYYTQTQPVIDAYEAEGKLIRVNGEQSVQKVTEDIFAALDQITSIDACA